MASDWDKPVNVIVLARAWAKDLEPGKAGQLGAAALCK
jgi:hypothetical protein